MKKLCLSLGAIVLSGLVLASCSGVKINKPKSKGSAVDSVSVTTSEGTYEFKKDDKFADVYSKLSSYQYFTIDNTLSGDNYEYAYKTKSSVSGKMTYTNYINEDNQYLYKKYVATAKQTYIEDNYFKGEEKDGNYKLETYYNSVSKEKYKYESAEETKTSSEEETKTYGGTYSNEREVHSVNFGIFKSEVKKNSTKTKTTKDSKNEKEKSYKYVNETENPTDENYGKTRYGYDKDGNYYSYQISSFFYDHSPLMLPISYYIMYNEAIEDICDYSFELTDNYIILKGTSKLTRSILNDMSGYVDAESQEDFYKKAKDLVNTDYKGSKLNIEIWIDYTRDSSTEGEKMLTLSYAKYKEVSKFNYKRTYTEKQFQNSYFDKAFIDEVKGKEYTAKGSMTTTGEIGDSSDNYSKKIEKFQKKNKKNNIYDNITFFYAKY